MEEPKDFQKAPGSCNWTLVIFIYLFIYLFVYLCIYLFISANKFHLTTVNNKFL